MGAATQEQLLLAKKKRTKKRKAKLKAKVDKRTSLIRRGLEMAKDSVKRRDALLEQAQAKIDELQEKLNKYEPPVPVTIPGIDPANPGVGTVMNAAGVPASPEEIEDTLQTEK